MEITKKDVQRIASLARLELDGGETAIFREQLSKIIGYVDKLNEVDVEETDPTSHVIAVNNVFREDHGVQPLTSEESLRNAPDRSGSFFRVPKIIE